MRPLKIILWSPKGCGNHYYGPGKNAFNLYSEIKKSKELDLVLVHAYPGHEESTLFDEVYKIGDFNQNKIIPFIKYTYNAFGLLWKYRNQGFIFHGLDVYSNIFIPALIAKALGYPVALKLAAYPSGFSASNNKLLLIFRRKMISYIDIFFAISHEIYNELLSLKVESKKIKLVYNGVEVPEYFKGNSESPPVNIRTILFTGALVRRKRPHLLIEAIGISKSPYSWKLLLVGPMQDQCYFDEMKALVGKYGLSERVQFLGFKSDLRDFYLSADVYALPSLSEGMPNGVLEAMSYSLPIIISNFSSANILCNNGNGYIADSAVKISNCLDLFLSNESDFREKGSKSLELIELNFKLINISKSYIQTFNDYIE